MAERVERRAFVIKNKLGLHARAANLMVQLASNFESTITVEKDGVEANGKSIMGILLLAAGEGAKIVVKARGRDAREAIEELGKLIEGKFGEK
ncbi:MAG: HPr family phosphocarrier protein [Deltaproteobacteria bacterium]|nr:MAG: HPr family phosphocarrier protein [Deltaproteobacteria bacterium]